MSARPHFNGQFRQHDPLTLKLARTTREAAADPADWWEGPATDATRDHWRGALLDALCWLVAVAGLAVLAWAALKVPGA